MREQGKNELQNYGEKEQRRLSNVCDIEQVTKLRTNMSEREVPVHIAM